MRPIMNRSDGINVALCGYGYAGKTFHAPLVMGVSGLNLAAVVSSDERKVREDFPQIAVSASHDQVFADNDIELVVVATPNDTHYDLAKRALLAGKHVVVDKPFTTTSSEAEELIKLAGEQNRFLSVFHNRRWDSDFLTVRRLLEEGALGEVMHFESHFDRYRPEVRQRWREQAGAASGIWYDLGPHLLDQVLQLFGMPDAIQADLEMQRDQAQSVDYFHVVLRYGKMRAVLHGGALVAADSPRFTIHGKLGSYIKFGLDTQEDALKRKIDVHSKDFGIDGRDGLLTIASGLVDGAALVSNSLPTERGDYLAYYSGVRDAVRNGAPNPVAPDDAMAVMRLIELGSKSSDSKTVLSCRLEP